MEPIVVDTNDVNFPNLDESITELEKFIEAQRNTLTRIQQETKSLEELKRQAVAQPGATLRNIIAGEHNALKFSNATLGLTVELPRIDWTLIEANDLNYTSPSKSGSSRANKLIKHISDFHQTLARLAPLPQELLDDDDQDPQERGKKRRRIDPGPRNSTTHSSSGLRLPYPTESTESQPPPPPRTLQSLEVGHPSTSSSSDAGGRNLTKTPDAVTQLYPDYPYSQQRGWVSKGVSDDAHTPHESPSSMNPTSQDIPPTPAQPVENSPVTFTMEEPATELLGAAETLTTFKQNWTLAEQHTLERLLVEIPSTVKFRWVRISEAMGGTRTPRQVASRVQKYYEKMKKLGVAVNSADMGGGGRGGSKATQTLDTPPTMRTKGSSTRGKPKTGPQYTKSGRRR